MAGLAEAMRSLIDRPDLLDQLRPAPGQLALRTVGEQADGLERRYRSLAARPVAGPSVPARRSAGCCWSTGIGSAPLRYRGRLPAEALADLGVHMDVHHYRDVSLVEKARTADAVVLYRVPATEQILDLITMVRARPEPVPVLYDIDDLVFEPGLAAELNPVLQRVVGLDLELYWQGVRRYRTTLEACDGFVGSTRLLCDTVHRLTGLPVYRYPNGVGRRTRQDQRERTGTAAATGAGPARLLLRYEHPQRGLGVR